MSFQVKIKRFEVKILVACFFIATLAWGTVFYGHSVYLESLTRIRSWTTQEISSAILIFWLASLPGTLFVGYLIDSKGPTRVISIGALFIGFGIIGLGQVEKLWQIFLCYAAMGFAYPAIGVAGISAILEPWFSKTFGFALGVALTGASLGGAVIPVSMVYLIGIIGFKITMLFIGGSVLVILFSLAMFFENKEPDNSSKVLSKNKNQGFSWHILRTLIFWRITIAAALGLGTQVGFLAHQIPIVADIAGELGAALTVSIVAISAAIGRLLIAYASRSISVTKLAATSYLIQGIGIFIITLADTFFTVIVACSVAGFVVGGIVMLPPILIREAFGSAGFGKNYAMANVILYIFAGMGPYLVGVVYNSTISYTLGLWFLAFTQVLAAMLIFKPLPNKKFNF